MLLAGYSLVSTANPVSYDASQNKNRTGTEPWLHRRNRADSASRRLRPDVVFLDLALPRMDGFEVARQLRADPVLRAALIIAVTGSAQEEDRQRVRDAGFDHHLVKPADPAFIESLLRRKR